MDIHIKGIRQNQDNNLYYKINIHLVKYKLRKKGHMEDIKLKFHHPNNIHQYILYNHL